jgi:multiple antibiotic resistance protein
VNTFVNTFLLVYAALFPIVNPFGSAPFFLSLTEQYTNIERARMSRQIAINSFLLLLGSLLIGSHLLGFFGVSLPIVRVAGGLVVTAFGWKLLNSPAQAEHDHDAQQAAAHDDPDTFYPLTMPLTVGPGSISVAITIGANQSQSVRSLIVNSAAHIASMLLVAVAIFVSLRYADRIMRRLGPTGTAVLLRLSAFILLCIGVQILWNGVSSLVPALR